MSSPEAQAGLKPCPFCGSPAELANYVVDVVVKCTVCPAKITSRHDLYGDDAPGIARVTDAWNTRPIAAQEAPPAPLTAEEE